MADAYLLYLNDDDCAVVTVFQHRSGFYSLSCVSGNYWGVSPFNTKDEIRVYLEQQKQEGKIQDFQSISAKDALLYMQEDLGV